MDERIKEKQKEKELTYKDTLRSDYAFYTRAYRCVERNKPNRPLGRLLLNTIKSIEFDFKHY